MENLLIYLLKSAGLLSIFLLVYQLLLKNDTSFRINRYFLSGGILTAAFLPALQFTRSVPPEHPVLGSELPLTAEASTPILLTESIDWWEMFGYLYGVVALLLMFRILLQLFSLMRIIRNGSSSREGSFTLITTSMEVAPFSFFRYIVYNPKLHTGEELEIILKHEKAHASQWHSLDVLLAHMTTALLWFNPLSWGYQKILVQNLEFLADRETLAEVSKKAYQQTLVKIAVSNQQPFLANNFHQSFIKKRILMLNRKSVKNNTALKIGSIIPFLLVFILTFNIETKAQGTSIPNGTQTYSIGIKAETPDEGLQWARKHFAKKDIQLEFKDVRRSSEGLITQIKIAYKTPKGTTGNYVLQDTGGIKAFEISLKDGEISFTEPKNTFQGSSLLQKVGDNPLLIVNAKEYSSKELSGKIIRLDAAASALNPEEAEKYGSKAADGVIIVPSGEIMEYSAALEEFDASEQEQKQFLWLQKDSKPVYVTAKVNVTNPEDELIPDVGSINASEENKPDTHPQINQKPLIILDGVVQSEDFDLNSIEPENIASINVLKGKKATDDYGEKAKDGVIMISTKDSSNKNEKPSKAENESDEKNASSTSKKTFYLTEVEFTED